MLAWEKLKESFISVAPIMVIVYLLHVTLIPLHDALPSFFAGGTLLILGMGIFLVGAEIAIVPVGQKTGAALTAKRNLPLMLGVGFIIGFFATVAEPDVQVLATQVSGVDASINSFGLIAIIGVGVGIFVAIAMGRSVLRVSLKKVLAFFYIGVFICAALTSPAFLGIAFDAGGATTGPMTVPFIMAIGVGVASVFSKAGNSEDQSFGFIGLASVGPVLAVLVLGMLFTGSQGTAPSGGTPANELSLSALFLHLLPEVSKEVLTAIGPLIVLFALFQIFLLRMPPVQVARIVAGLTYTFAGLVLFFLGVKSGFMPMGALIGERLASLPENWVLLPVGFLLGAVVVCAEPAVWVLNNQVERVSGGHIKFHMMLVSLSVGVAFAVGLAMLRVLAGISLWYFLIPGYALTFIMTRFCPTMFTAIAFDSGGVASGPMASSFILSFAIGAAKATGGGTSDAFGVIALIAMTPLIAIQTLGILYARKEKDVSRKHESCSKE